MCDLAPAPCLASTFRRMTVLEEDQAHVVMMMTVDGRAIQVLVALDGLSQALEVCFHNRASLRAVLALYRPQLDALARRVHRPNTPAVVLGRRELAGLL